MRCFLRAVPVVLLVASVLMLFRSRNAETVPLYASRTGLMCQSCHFDPNGGGPRNDFGFAFARNRHSLDAEPEGSPWHDLDVTNRIGEKMPVYVGLNHRFMMLTNNTSAVKGPDRFGFFNMENALHVTFQPHARLALVYTRDGFDSESNNKDAYGMIGGFPWNGYLRAGRFRAPFGLRMDDHTVATRNSFLEFSSSPRSPAGFLPYDPRIPDAGVEFGMSTASIFGRAAFTNGGTNILRRNGEYAETKTVKLGYNAPWYQAAISLYDGYHKVPVSGVKRQTRWGYYGMTHFGPLSLLGEVAAGTDEAEPPAGQVTGAKTNRLAFFAEADYAPIRWLNLRLRYDRLVLDRSSVQATRDLNTHSRYAVEAEYVPVPFAELRGTVRRIDHKIDNIAGLEDETQSYIQFHFSY